MLTKEQRLAHIERGLQLLNNTGGTDKDWMLSVIREQEAALAEAREFVELTATLTPCTPSQYMRAQTWVKVYDAAHPAPKETP
jgi:hypothetical protein